MNLYRWIKWEGGELVETRLVGWTAIARNVIRVYWLCNTCTLLHDVRILIQSRNGLQATTKSQSISEITYRIIETYSSRELQQSLTHPELKKTQRTRKCELLQIVTCSETDLIRTTISIKLSCPNNLKDAKWGGWSRSNLVVAKIWNASRGSALGWIHWLDGWLVQGMHTCSLSTCNCWLNKSCVNKITHIIIIESMHNAYIYASHCNLWSCIEVTSPLFRHVALCYSHLFCWSWSWRRRWHHLPYFLDPPSVTLRRACSLPPVTEKSNVKQCAISINQLKEAVSHQGWTKGLTARFDAGLVWGIK